MSNDPQAVAPTSGRWGPRWSVPVLGFVAFAVGTCELVLAGVLPELSRSLGVSISTGGQVVTAFGVTCAVLAPILATASARWQRRTVLLLSVLVYLAGIVGTALAPSFVTVVLAQVVAAAGAGLFLPTATVTASALVPAERRGRAIAVVTTGMTAATALGAPAGTVIGDLAGWRATMWFVAGLTVLAGLALTAVLPARVSAPAPESLRERVRPLADGRVLALLATTLVAFTAVYLPYTYIAAVFAPATGGSGVRLAVLMSALGVVGILGNFVAGAWTDRLGGRTVVAGALAGLALGLAAMPFATDSLLAAGAVIVIYGFAGFAITSPQSHRLITLAPQSASVLVSLNAAVLYLAISLSGIVGAVGMGVVGAAHLGFIAAGIALLALAASELGHRLTQRSLAPSAKISTAGHTDT